MKAVILVAGIGSRLKPLTDNRPKHLLPVASKPLLEHLLTNIRETGIKEVILVVGYRHKMIERYFQNMNDLGLLLTYVHQEKPLGTANAIGLAQEHIEDDYFLVVYGDLYLSSSVITSLIKNYSEENLTTMGVVSVQNPYQFGVVKLKNKFVEAIIEKPRIGERFGNLVNAGIYVFPKNIFKEISQTGVSRRSEVEITDTISSLLKKNTPIIAHIINNEHWLDLGRPWDLLEANKRALTDVKSDFEGEVEPGVYMSGEVVIKKGARIRSGSYLEGPILIGCGSDIGPNCYIRPFSNIGKDVHTGNACEVKASVILDKTHIGHLSYIGDSIIGENCNLGAGTVIANLRFDNQEVKVTLNSKLVDSGLRKLGVMMGDDVKTGIGVNIMPGIKIGSNVWIGPNTTIYQDVKKGAFVVQKQNLHFRERRKI